MLFDKVYIFKNVRTYSMYLCKNLILLIVADAIGVCLFFCKGKH